MELFTNGYEGTAGEDHRYDMNDEMVKLRSTALLNNWINKIKRSKPQYTVEDFRYIMNQDKKLFNDLIKNVCWGDSFAIDQMFFKTGGSKRFIDYPDLKITEENQIVVIDGIARVVGNLGVLTFDIFVDEEEISENENTDTDTTPNTNENVN